MKTDVRAFTILEMLINIAIMSIIIGMVYFVYSSFAKQVSFYQADVEEENTINSFCLRIKMDFFNAEKIIGASNSFETVEYNKKRVYYKVENGFLFRIQQQDIDSLQIEKVDIIGAMNPITNENLIQKVQIDTYMFENKIDFTVTKKYPVIPEIDLEYGH